MMSAPAPQEAPLLLACALGIERRALRGGLRRGPAADVALLRTGMGPAAARRAVAQRLRDTGLRTAPVLATGFCAGLETGMRPGDVLVATTAQLDGERIDCHAPDLLAEAIGRLGHTVHRGTLAGSDHVVRPPERRALREGGAHAVDMESAAVLSEALRAGPRPVAAVRVVVDAPGHELIRIGTLRGGLRAYRVLSSVLPAFFQWHSTSLPRR
ncbi:1-hydroxy-2-methyl-2-butenyl 4-diphosphate reductase [Streptomyces polyrhachis]|uniref:1-hydroxy-2-methyl-2-butenyl 4-diphosphate reductase n=1 Tax=Streptomyces polyrhachis TaxID=1282885 RepID=A0ABW2GE14_9ACTN